ncbi:MAG: phytanoyl-CoA dioxygenase family protein [Acidobacteriota bacterium]
MINLTAFEREGFAIEPSLLSSLEIAQLIALIEQHGATETHRGGVRDIMHRIPALQAVAQHGSVRSIVDHILGPQAFAVRSTLFDKTPDANWKVPWHQDLTVAVAERIDTPGYGPWSTKAGVTHVQPPTGVLASMLTVRIHLDPCPATNGALRVIPGTHQLGRLNQNNVEPHISEEAAICCAAGSGAALIMRPLLLHASSASTDPGHRRVLHFDFAATPLDGNLRWAMGGQPAQR